MSHTWEQNAARFAELDTGEGWPFALLVACSVEKGAGQGARNFSAVAEKSKVSAVAFKSQLRFESERYTVRTGINTANPFSGLPTSQRLLRGHGGDNGNQHTGGIQQPLNG